MCNLLFIDSPTPVHGVHLVDVGLHQLTFSWNMVLPNCPAISYNLTTKNCGICESITAKTTVTCNELIIDGRVCTFAVTAVVCDNTEGAVSNVASREVILRSEH